MPLFARPSERVALGKLAPGTRFERHEHPGGEETFVLGGAWLRNPPGSAHEPFSADGCALYVKTGHLAG